MAPRAGRSSGFNMAIEGLDELSEALTDAEKAIVHDAQIDAMNKVAPLVVAEAQSLLPSHWILRNSITFNIRERKNKIDMIVGPSKENEYNGQNPGIYGRYHETGYRGKYPRSGSSREWDTKPKWFMRTAFSRLRETITRIIQEETTNAVESITASRVTP